MFLRIEGPVIRVQSDHGGLRFSLFYLKFCSGCATQCLPHQSEWTQMESPQEKYSYAYPVKWKRKKNSKKLALNLNLNNKRHATKT